MALYCGIDLHSRDSWLAILDEGLEVIGETKERRKEKKERKGATALQI